MNRRLLSEQMASSPRPSPPEREEREIYVGEAVGYRHGASYGACGASGWQS